MASSARRLVASPYMYDATCIPSRAQVPSALAPASSIVPVEVDKLSRGSDRGRLVPEALMLIAPCALPQPPHQRFLRSVGVPKLACLAPQPSHSRGIV